jgi:hypothetical protein
VEPPNAIVITKAFSKDSFVMRSRGRIFFSIHTLIASAAFVHSRIFAGDSAGFEEDPGRQRPIASMAVDIVLAVYMPPQAPAPGQACCSRSSCAPLVVLQFGNENYVLAITSLGVRPFSPAPDTACNLP